MVILVQYEVSEKDAQDQGIGENTTSEEELLVSILPGICPQLRTRIFRFVLS